MKDTKFDVFVVGSGIAGQTVAKICASNGLNVAIADDREFGGTCSNRGCDPKKVLLGPTEAYESAKSLLGNGITSLPKLNWKKLQRFKRTFTDAIPARTEEDLMDRGITLFHQSPKFLDKNVLSVEGKTVTAGKIVIATGQIPRKLQLDGHQFLKTSDDFLRLKKLPKKIVFIGSGYIGMEFAHMAARAGSMVIVLEQEELILDSFDGDLVAHLKQVSEEIGIKFYNKAEVFRIQKLRKNFRIKFRINSEEDSLKAEMVFNTAGRVPAIAELDLEKGNVHYSKKGILVNQFLQNTGNPNVYSCGDVSSYSLPLTPLSYIEGKVVAENIIHGNRKQIKIPVVPSVVFTIPNLATVGFSEELAKKRFKNVKVNCESVPDWYNAKRINEKHYVYKVLINERTNKILGAHLLAPQASETINLFAMAINQGMTVNDLKNTIFTYPSWANDIKSML